MARNDNLSSSTCVNPVNFRFAVYFLGDGGDTPPIDTRFQRVSGLSAKLDTSAVVEGGENLFTHRLPTRVGYQNLVLERGMVLGATLDREFGEAMNLFRFTPHDVMVTLLDERGDPAAAWMFYRAYPVAWATADLTVAKEDVLIDTLELAYTRMQLLRL